MAEATHTCLLCGQTEAKVGPSVQDKERPDRWTDPYDCPRCGKYRVPNTMVAVLTNIRGGQRTEVEERNELISKLHFVSGYLRERALAGMKPLVLTEENLPGIVAAAPKDITGRIDKLLMNLASMSKVAGAGVGVQGKRDYPLGYCETQREFSFFLASLDQRGFIRREGGDLVVTADGWARVEELRRQQPLADRAFVAMNFDPELDTVWENGIKAAFEGTGYVPQRADSAEYVDKIDDHIIYEINRSKFVVADFTGQKHGVYFEVGYALGKGLTVIWTCRKREVEAGQLHFDIRQYNMIAWEDEEELRRRLHDRIKALIA